MVRQKAILDLALQFDNACTAKEDLRKAYEKCNDILQESCALIDTFLKEGSDKDYELNLSMYRKLHQLHLDEETLKETLEEAARDEKAQEEKIRQNQADDKEFFLEFKVELSLDIDDFDLHLTPIRCPSSSTCIEPSPSTPNPVRIIPGPVGIVQQAKLLKEKMFILDLDGALMSTQEYMQKVVEDVGEEDDFKSGAWISVTNYVTATGGTVIGCLGDINNFMIKQKLDQVVAIVNSCSLNVIGDLTVTMKDLSSTIPGTIHYKVIGDGGYGKDITVGDAMILANVSVFTPKPSKHYLNITMKNVVKVFRKDSVPKSGSG
ncbi:transposase, MuDR, MULE transposase domain protein [Tanacetum coccineum]